jgi:hypothetical protein
MTITYWPTRAQLAFYLALTSPFVAACAAEPAIDSSADQGVSAADGGQTEQDSALPVTDGAATAPDTGTTAGGDLAPVKGLVTASSTTKATVYFFLFTHTEDHINHQLSEDRYLKLAPVVASLAGQSPDAHLVWTIMLMGADAKTISDRTKLGQSTVATLLKTHAAQGVIQFGYHAFHDPTYTNRPQNSLTNGASWQDEVGALDQWISCEKDPLYGGCVKDSGGGIEAIQNNFGSVKIVSGAYPFSDGVFETDSGFHTIAKHEPTRQVGFGFSDHGPGLDKTKVQQLLSLMAPSVETSPSVFWMNNAIRINDSGLTPGVSTLDLKQGKSYVETSLKGVDRSRPHLFNVGFASKYLYTKSGTSPTKWAYANPTSPELPLSQQNSASQTQKLYDDTSAALSYLALDFVKANSGSRFVSSDDVVAAIAPSAYWTVNKATLDALARWIVQKWNGRPPNYASDGVDFYSLRDSFTLLAKALGESELPISTQLTAAYGPRTSESGAGAVALSATEIRSLAKNLAQKYVSESWASTPTAQLEGSVQTSAGSINTAQLLYAMALCYAKTYAKHAFSTVQVPASEAMPETYQLLKDLGSARPEGDAWSLKPARIRSLP